VRTPAVELTVPSSKSGTHRAFLLGALSSVPCRVRRPLWGADCRSTLSVLQALGARAEVQGDSVVFQPVDALQPTPVPLDCGNSGTTLRLMSGQVARLSEPVTLTGDDSLQSRPNQPLLDALEALQATTHSQEGRAPLTIRGPLQAGTVSLPPRVSSQYASALLLALCLVPGDSTLHMAAPVASRPYLEITRQVAAAFGLRWSVHETPAGLRFQIPGNQQPAASDVAVAGDWSGAAFPLVAAVLAGVPVRLIGLRPDDPQGDRAVVDILRRFGQELVWDGPVLALNPRPPVSPGTVDLGPTPDLFPVLVALAAATPGHTSFVGAPSLRHKESDRIAAMATALAALGVSCTERPDGLDVHGGPLRAAQVQSLHDHRIYMALRVLTLVCPAIEVDGRGCEAVSYPHFEAHLSTISAARA